MSLRLNPQYEKMLPMMSQEEFEHLKESIRTEGQHYPIIVSEDLEVLDGHHRFRACLELGIDPDFEVKHFEDKLLEKKFVIEANLRRRHLNNFQLVELAVPLLEIEKALAKKHYAQKSLKESTPMSELNDKDEPFSGFNSKENTKIAVAKKAGVSPRTLERGKKIIEKASEDEKQKLREGKTSISKVYHDITPQKTALKQEISTDDFKVSCNKKALAEILQTMLKQDLFCPECGNKLFQCSQCHKSLNELLKEEKGKRLKTAAEPHLQTAKTDQDKQVDENENSFEAQEGFKDEFF
jgi:predicted RNA-binding Zn-ribbon protein involved in translation (DUF1610 family)